MRREEIVKILESNETFNEVLNIIKHECHIHGTQFDDIPNSEFISGGAIANTIHYIFNKERFDRPIINDVDLFVFNFLDTYWGHNEVMIDSFIQSDLQRVVGDDYGQYFITNTGDSINMRTNERIGIINKVMLDVYSRKSRNVCEYYSELINNFDLNCCMAGLDRLNNKIVYTDDFVDFILNNKIEVTHLKFPLQTAYRMKKKCVELDTITTNFETEILLLKQATTFHGGNSFGEVWSEKIKRDYELFAENFEICDYHTRHQLDDDMGLKFYKSKKLPMLEVEVLYQKDLASLLDYDKNTLLSFWDLVFRGKYNDEVTHNLNKFINSMAETTRHTKRGLNGLFILKCLNTSKNYFNGEFKYEYLVRFWGFYNYLLKNGIQVDVFIVDNIKNQMKIISYFKKRFIKDNLFRSRYFNTVIDRIRYNKSMEFNLSSTDYSDKLAAFKFGVKNFWIGWNGYKLTHRFYGGRLGTLDF